MGIRRISVINYKGGTGKTSTAVSLAHGLALRGRRVLLVDTDPQGSAGYHLGIMPKTTLYDVLLNKQPVEACIVNARKNLDMICANEHLFPAELEIAKHANREHILSKRLEKLTQYEFIIIDCAPSMNLMNQNALVFSEEIILPVSMEYLSLVGVKQLLKNIKIVNKIFKKQVQVTMVVPTFYDKRNKKSEHVLNSLIRVFPNQVSTPVRVCVALSEAPGRRETVFEYDPHSTGADDYYKLVEEVLAVG
jgi:chromosome partitioning protein